MSKPISNRRILIVGEGRETEYNYFVGFRKEFEEELKATKTAISVCRGKGGNAENIVNNAIRAAKDFQPDRKRGDRVFLLLDTEGAGRAPELPAAEKLAKSNNIDIIYSSPAFEYWLLCHFDKIPRKNFKDCQSAIVELDKRWSSICTTPYDKADQDVFKRLSLLINTARTQALEIDLHHLKTTGIATGTNPSTQVYELIAILIGVKSGERCPLSGTWKLTTDHKITTQIQKGEAVPENHGSEAHWCL